MNVADHPSGKMNPALGAPWAGKRTASRDVAIARVFDAILRRTKPRIGARYLTLAGGAGLAFGGTRDRGADVTSLDPSGALPFGENSFDLVTDFDAFLRTENPVGALQEAVRVVKPEGIVAIVARVGPGGTKQLLPENSRLRQFAHAAGLRSIQVFDVESPESRTCGHRTGLADDALPATARTCVAGDKCYWTGVTFRVLLSEPTLAPRMRRAEP